MTKIARVFPRRTSLTPTDDLAFIGYHGGKRNGKSVMITNPLPLDKPNVDEVHVSCCFTWDIERAKELQKAWGQYYPVVKIGGAAFDDPCLNFTPGMYLKTGVTFTSRGCNNHCEYCLVPAREGRLQTIDDFPAGNIIQDNNLLQTGKAHISKVIEMLKTQNAASFSGGIESDLVSDWFANELQSITVKNLFLACDSDDDIPALQKATQKLCLLDRFHTHTKLMCYVLIGRETIEQAMARLESVWEIGAMPFAQLFQPAEKWIDYSLEWRHLQRNWSRPAIIRVAHNECNPKEVGQECLTF